MNVRVFAAAVALSAWLMPVWGASVSAPLYNLEKSGAGNRTISKATRSSRVQKAPTAARRSAAKTTTTRRVSESQTSAPRTISSWPTGRKLVCLTFDDGPNNRITPQLLELLGKKNVKATFYLIGEQVVEFPKVVQEIVRQGHEVGNHTYTHKILTKYSAATMDQELQRAEDALTSVTGHKPATMRPPGGAYNNQLRELCERMGYKVILWDVDTNDWKRPSTQSMIDNVVQHSKDGSIVLMHDRYKNTLDVTAAVIDGLRQRGYEFVTVSQLLAFPRQESTKASPATATPARGGALMEGEPATTQQPTR